MMDKFREAEKIYRELKEKRDRGEITKQEFITELQKLMFKDEKGRFWALGTTSGKWHYYDGSKWIPAEPPYQKETTVVCPYCGFENPENSVICIKCEKSLKKNLVICPRCGKEIMEDLETCPYCDYTFEPKKETKEIYLRISKIRELGFAFFLGGAGLILGIVFGALIGVLSSLPFVDILPDAISSTRGHFLGAILFGGGGAILGFLSFSFAGLLISLFLNFIFFLFGGPKIKAFIED